MEIDVAYLSDEFQGVQTRRTQHGISAGFSVHKVEDGLGYAVLSKVAMDEMVVGHETRFNEPQGDWW